MLSVDEFIKEIEKNTDFDIKAYINIFFHNNKKKINALECDLNFDTVRKTFIQINKYNGKFLAPVITRQVDEDSGRRYHTIFSIDWLDENLKLQTSYMDEDDNKGMHYNHETDEIIELKEDNSVDFILN